MDMDEFSDRLMWSEVMRRMAWMEANKYVGEDGKTYCPLPPPPIYMKREVKDLHDS